MNAYACHGEASVALETGQAWAGVRHGEGAASGYWEWRRLPYNLVLGAVFCACAVTHSARFAQQFDAEAAVALFVLATLANACYCTAYAWDWLLQLSPSSEHRQRMRRLLWTLGTLCAAAFTWYWCMHELFVPLPS